MQWPNMNVAAQSFADVQVYKAMSVLDTFPIGDPEVLIRSCGRSIRRRPLPKTKRST